MTDFDPTTITTADIAANLDLIEKGAKLVFLNNPDGANVLLAAWETVAPDEQAQYPNIAFQTAKIYLNRGQTVQGRKLLTTAAQGWQHDSEQQARVFILHANLSVWEGDIEAAIGYIERVKELSTDAVLLAETEFLLGETLRRTDPQQAFKHYDRAKTLHLRVSVHDPNAYVDVVRSAIGASMSALSVNQTTVAKYNQRHAEEMVTQLGYPELHVGVQLNAGRIKEYEGKFDEALALYDALLDKAVDSPKRLAEINNRRARISLFQNDYESALEILSIPIDAESPRARAESFWLQGWWAAMNGQLRDAADRLEAFRTYGHSFDETEAQAGLLAGLVAAKARTDHQRVIEHVQESVAYFHANYRLAEEMQAKLILAWLTALANDLSRVDELIRAIEWDISRIKHVRHIVALYEASSYLLNGWWNPESVQLMEAALSEMASDGIRVFGFGYPRLYARRGEVKKIMRGPTGLKLVLFMLDMRHANLWELVAAIYPESAPEQGQNNVHRLLKKTRTALNKPDWCVYDPDSRNYRLGDKFPDYFDVRDFEYSVDQFRATTSPVDKFALSLKILRLYQPYARGLHGEHFDDMRRQRHSQFELVLDDARQLLHESEGHVPEQMYQDLRLASAAWPEG